MNDLINIESKILLIRGQHVMLDRDLAGLYGVETKVLNQAVKRNIERFPEQFCFQMNETEFKNWRSQFVTSKNLKSQTVTSSWGGRRKLSYAFTEQGVAMRRFLLNNARVFQRLDRIEAKQIETDHDIETIFTLMDKYKIEDKQGIFFQGQIYDAYSQFQKFIQQAQKEIILIDNYIDLTVLDRLRNKNTNVAVTIYTRPDTIVKPLAIKKFNNQYPTLTMKYTTTMHDRFLIIDSTEIYHIGASLKDLGKKCFGFTRLEDAQLMIKTVLNALEHGIKSFANLPEDKMLKIVRDSKRRGKG